MPLQHRHGYAAGIHRGLPVGDITQPESSLRRSGGARCCPAQICQVRAGGFVLRGVQPLVPHVRLSVSLAGPGPSGSAGPSRRCQGCCPPSPSSQGSGCPQLRPARCDEPEAVSFHHRRVRERLVGARRPTTKPGWVAGRSARAARQRDRCAAVVVPGSRRRSPGAGTSCRWSTGRCRRPAAGPTPAPGATSQYSSPRSTATMCWRSASVSLFAGSGRGGTGRGTGDRRRR